MENRYEIRGKIGQGGIGSVHRGWDRKMEREVAIKRIRTSQEDPSLEEEATKQMMAEAEALASLQHPHIVTIYDIGHDETGPYVVMELINGQSLDEVIENGPMTWHDFKKVALETLEALIAAQELDMIHSDLKPPNIMLSWLPSGTFQAKIVDFGLAMLVQNQSKEEIEKMDSVFGSIFFMPPEQFERKTLDVRSDLYSIGCVYYQCLTGVYPFNGENGNEVMEAHLNHTVTPIQELRDDIPPWAAEWVMWLINRERDDRPQSARVAQSTFLEKDKQSTQPTSRRPRLIVGDKTSPVSVATARQQVQENTTSPVRTAMSPAPTTTSSHPHPQPAGAVAQPWWLRHKRRLAIGAGALVLISIFASMLTRRNERVMLENDYSRFIEMVSEQKASEVPMNGGQLKFILEKLSTFPGNTNISKVLKVLQRAKSTDATPVGTTIARFATTAEMADEIRLQIIDEVIAERQELETVPIMLGYAGRAGSADLAASACDAVQDMVGADEAPELLALVAATRHAKARETAAFVMEMVIKHSDRPGRLAPLIRRSRDKAASPDARKTLDDLVKLAEREAKPRQSTPARNTPKPEAPRSVKTPDQPQQQDRVEPSPRTTPRTTSSTSGNPRDWQLNEVPAKLKPIIAALDGNDRSRKIEALNALGKIGSHEAHTVFLVFIEDLEDEELRRIAFKSATELSSLPSNLTDRRGAVRRWKPLGWRCKSVEERTLVVDALVKLRTDWAIDQLKDMSNKGPKELHSVAKQALEAMEAGDN